MARNARASATATPAGSSAVLTAGPLADLDTLRTQLRQLQDEARWRRDAWAFVSECVTTVDELDAVSPIKPFPVAVCAPCERYVGHVDRLRCPRCGAAPAPLAYLEQLARQWQSATPPLLLVPKARRMRLTWLFMALHVWLAWTRPASKSFVVSSKQEKSGELIERARGIIARLPFTLHVTSRSDPPELRLSETDALVMGVAEGADQLRQYTATAILADEFGTWVWPRNAYAAMRPCIDGGGRLTVLSSAYPGFWRELVAGEALG